MEKYDRELQGNAMQKEGALAGNRPEGEGVINGPATDDYRILEEFDRKRLEGKIEYARSVLEGILFRMGVTGKVEPHESEREIVLDVQGDGTGLLIGKHGKTLDALQYLLNKIYQRRFGEGERVFLDTENYRKRRSDALEGLAHRLGEKVRKQKRAVVVGIFNPRDRRIIHMALREDSVLETESKGEGFYKKIIIRLRGDRGSRD